MKNLMILFTILGLSLTVLPPVLKLGLVTGSLVYLFAEYAEYDYQYGGASNE